MYSSPMHTAILYILHCLHPASYTRIALAHMSTLPSRKKSRVHATVFFFCSFGFVFLCNFECKILALPRSCVLPFHGCDQPCIAFLLPQSCTGKHVLFLGQKYNSWSCAPPWPCALPSCRLAFSSLSVRRIWWLFFRYLFCTVICIALPRVRKSHVYSRLMCQGAVCI